MSRSFFILHRFIQSFSFGSASFASPPIVTFCPFLACPFTCPVYQFLYGFHFLIRSKIHTSRASRTRVCHRSEFALLFVIIFLLYIFRRHAVGETAGRLIDWFHQVCFYNLREEMQYSRKSSSKRLPIINAAAAALHGGRAFLGHSSTSRCTHSIHLPC